MIKLESSFYAGFVFTAHITTMVIMANYDIGWKVMEQIPLDALNSLFPKYEAITWSALMRTAVLLDRIQNLKL